jgi:sugar O-acyltransferase (sialic acid O-acetyltransferase NeuD family)
VSLVIVGAGDHGRVMAEATRAAGHAVMGFVDPTERTAGSAGEVDGFPVLGLLGDPQLLTRFGADTTFVVALGSNQRRREAFDECRRLGWQPATIVHPTAILLGGSRIGVGSQVCAAAVIGVAAQIGVDVIVNTAASVDHDGRVGDHAFIGPGAHLAGRVTVEEGAHVGIGAIVREGCTIGAWSYVAAGAVVVSDVPCRTRVAGIPARPMDHAPEDPA